MGDDRGSEKADSGVATGVFLLDKPAGVTSFGVVRQVRRLLGIRKVGHAGTLDPFATGLLIVCAGRPATRLIARFMAGRKRYAALLQLGRETETQDPEGRIIATFPVPPLREIQITDCLAHFVGQQMQAPPPYSAVKHQGKPLYHYARKGITIEKDPREIEIYALRFKGYDSETNQLRIEVDCSGGTYIRVLAADIGKALGCGAFLLELRRLGSGPFSVAGSLPGKVLTDSDGLELLLKAKLSLEHAVEMVDAGEKPVMACQSAPENVVEE